MPLSKSSQLVSGHFALRGLHHRLIIVLPHQTTCSLPQRPNFARVLMPPRSARLPTPPFSSYCECPSTSFFVLPISSGSSAFPRPLSPPDSAPSKQPRVSKPRGSQLHEAHGFQAEAGTSVSAGVSPKLLAWLVNVAWLFGSLVACQYNAWTSARVQAFLPITSRHIS